MPAEQALKDEVFDAIIKHSGSVSGDYILEQL